MVVHKFEILNDTILKELPTGHRAMLKQFITVHQWLYSRHTEEKFNMVDTKGTNIIVSSRIPQHSRCPHTLDWRAGPWYRGHA